MKFHFIYKTINLINKKYYIGVHSTFFLKDNYKGSGQIIKSALKKYKSVNFDFKILQFCETREEALKLEALIITEDFLKRPDVYNIRVGGYGGILTHNIDSREKIRQSKLGKPYLKKQKIK